MKVKGVDPNTGKEVEIEIDDPQSGFFETMRDFELSDDTIKKMIDKLDMSADVKLLLYKISKATIKVGEYVIKIGRKILDVVCYTLKEFPMATFGVVFCGIAGALISSIPALGKILGPLVTPILLVLGLSAGLVLDFQDKLLERKIAKKVAEFSPLASEEK